MSLKCCKKVTAPQGSDISTEHSHCGQQRWGGDSVFISSKANSTEASQIHYKC